MMDLIQNTDDIDGPGNNSYLFYDDTTGIVTIVPWDMNLAFGGMGGFGAGGRGGGGQFPGGGQMTEGTFVINGTPVAGQLPAMTNADGTPIAGQFPSMTDENGTPIAGMQGGAPDFQGGRDGNRGGMGGFGGGNPLVQRWNEVDAFTTLQADARTQLASDLFESGVATGILARWVDVLNTQATDLIDQTTIDSESQSLQEQIDAI